MNKTVSYTLLGATALWAVTIRGPAAFAQAAAQAAAGSANQEEIVVTARSREEKLKDVPVSMTALSGATLDKLDLSTGQQVALFTPGLTFPEATQGFFAGRLYNRPLIFRGLNLTNNWGITAAALTFLDGAALLGGDVPVGLDIARVEVLRGPQSVYFGRSTMTGAVNYVTKDPVNYWHGDFEAKIGTYETKKVQADASGPITDSLTVGLIGSTESNGGYDENPGNPGQMLGARSTDSVAATFDWRPTDALTVKGFANAFRENDGPPEQATLHASYDNCSLGGVNPYYCGPLPAFNQLQYGLWSNTNVLPQFVTASKTSLDLWNTDYFPPSEFSEGFGAQRHAILGHIIGTYEIGDFATLEGRLSYEHDMAIASIDGLAGPQALPPGYQYYAFSSGDNSANIDYEMRVRSAGEGPLQWNLGGTFIRADDVTKNRIDLDNPAAVSKTTPGAILGSNGLYYNINNPSITNSYSNNLYARTYGVYAGLSYDITDALQVTAEGRYQWDERSSQSVTSNLGTIFKSFSPRYAIDWKITPDVTAYASYAKGSRPGGFNAILQNPSYQPAAVQAQIVSALGPISIAYKQEDLKTWEAGVKGDYLDHRINLNADVYYGILENQQVSNIAFIPLLNASATIINNIGQSSIYGVEADGSAKLSDQLSIGGTFAWNHSRIDKYLCTACVAWTGKTSTPIGRNLAGGSPEFSGTLQGDYHDKLLQTEWTWYGHIDYIYRGPATIANYGPMELPARNVVDLRTGVENGSITIEGYITNVTNDRNYDSGGLAANDYEVGHMTAFKFDVPAPRVYGARVKYQFGGNTPSSPTTATYMPPPVQAPASH